MLEDNVLSVRTDISNGCEGEKVTREEGSEEFDEGGHVHAEGSEHAPSLWVGIKAIADLAN